MVNFSYNSLLNAIRYLYLNVKLKYFRLNSANQETSSGEDDLHHNHAAYVFHLTCTLTLPVHEHYS